MATAAPFGSYHDSVVLDPDTCYRALRAHDVRFDGQFFVAVSSTKIYCRPVCRVRAAKRENCTFYATAAAAEAAGYRPCLRCRPELAPGNSSFDAGPRIASQAATLLEGGLAVHQVATRLGITPRHLSRVFHSEFGVTPIEFAQTQRLLLAKRLLTDTALPVSVVAFSAGFRSLRRFHATLQQRYRLTSDKIRKSKPQQNSECFMLRLSYRPPYDWSSLLRFLAARAVAGIESVELETYRRVVSIDGVSGWIEVRPDGSAPALVVSASASLARVAPRLLVRLKHLFDLSSNPAVIMEALGKLAEARPGLRVPGAFDGFEIAVRAILGQQISVAAARTLACRLAQAYGTPVPTPYGNLNRAFPDAVRISGLSAEDLAQHGVLPARARTILSLAQLMAAGSLHLEPGSDVPETIAQLESIPGIGAWTAQYIAMRALAWPDAFPHTDLVIRKVLRENSPKKVLEAADRWRPWRAYAVMHLWNSTSIVC